MSQRKRAVEFPINVLFAHLQKKSRVLVWLMDDKDRRIEGTLRGFDEYMNCVLDDAFEISRKRSQRQSIGRIMLKGDAIALVQPL
jgi:small nuclear ribonucleoprotein E